MLPHKLPGWFLCWGAITKLELFKKLILYHLVVFNLLYFPGFGAFMDTASLFSERWVESPDTRPYALMEIRPFPGPGRVQKIVFSFTIICFRD